MAAMCGNEVWNTAGSKRTFTNSEDANKAYALLCDYEAFLGSLINNGIINIVDHASQPWETTTE